MNALPRRIFFHFWKAIFTRNIAWEKIHSNELTQSELNNFFIIGNHKLFLFVYFRDEFGSIWLDNLFDQQFIRAKFCPKFRVKFAGEINVKMRQKIAVWQNFETQVILISSWIRHFLSCFFSWELTISSKVILSASALAQEIGIFLWKSDGKLQLQLMLFLTANRGSKHGLMSFH